MLQGKEILVTGGAGFIGSNLVNLLSARNSVTVLDNFSSVDDRYIRHLRDRIRIVRGDITRPEELPVGHFDIIFHLAANSDVRGGISDPLLDFRVNAMGTVNVLEAARKCDAAVFCFASSSTVYGEAEKIPTPENYGPYMPISSYGASKMSGEGFVSAYSHYYGFKGLIFRFANIVGRNSTHGVIYDFIHKLMKNPRELEVLGDGTQKKSYMHVDDCTGAMEYLAERAARTEIFNLGNREVTSVMRIAEMVIGEMGLKDVRIRLTGGKDGRGWAGDVKYAHLDVEKLFSTGWKNRYSSDESVRVAIRETLSQMA
ncbi:UDP-glucose 4-epimerase [Thermogymnomonas acidicola]|uniref:UDP-glucose 4-epimerase n=1 Tax=Thermogymnomonas acidicola TaxID=399579 RepID=A0AA37BPE7_9ARCH|nr:NAD-dependent epimerase/dehydratase family protein [Thermogymnomonas acidicola]GGM66476.1 UDP-glucose 4-epimerase [Thermogymnomonas acidicola]